MSEERLVQNLSLSFEYTIGCAHRVFAPQNRALYDTLKPAIGARRARVCAFIDSGIVDRDPEMGARVDRYVRESSAELELLGEVTVVPGGERCKNDEALLRSVLFALDRFGVDRHAYVICVGGGAVLDMVGYASALTHRGVRIVRIPSTVLAQADSAVGVKNGVNAFGKKNFLGTFAPPWAVLIDPSLLETLPRRDVVAGMAEAVKVSLLRDPELFDWIRHNAQGLARSEPKLLEPLVWRSALLHAAHIARSGDPFERGTARPLDFGHWSAHRLEALSDHRLRHGEAVAIGMAIDLCYARDKGLADAAFVEDAIALLRQLGLPTWDQALEIRDPSGRPAVLRGLSEFREHIGGELAVPLVERPGSSFEVSEIDEGAMVSAIRGLREVEAA
jgi:3-dehydroquinate synthase